MKTILVVEDNRDWRELLTILLRRLGYEVVIAINGDEGVRQALAILPDLILMDIGLPILSGDQAITCIRSHPAGRNIPIVVQTAFGAGAEARRAMEAGATEVLHKPINIADLHQMVEKYLSSESPAPLIDAA